MFSTRESNYIGKLAEMTLKLLVYIIFVNYNKEYLYKDKGKHGIKKNIVFLCLLFLHLNILYFKFSILQNVLISSHTNFLSFPKVLTPVKSIPTN